MLLVAAAIIGLRSWKARRGDSGVVPIVSPPIPKRSGKDGMDFYLREATSAESDFVFETRREALGRYIDLAGGWDESREREAHADRWRRQRADARAASS